MARELSQEAVLDFLWGAGGRAPNAALLRHFQRFLRDPALPEQQRRERREYFKNLVNSLATVHPAAVPGASKDIVLRRRYRDLLDEELPPSNQQQQEEEEKEPPPPRRDPDGRRGPPEKGQPGVGQPPKAAASGGCAARGGPCCECRRARRAAAAPPPGPGAPTRAEPPPPYRTQPLSSNPGALTPAGPPPPYRTQPLSSGAGAPTPAAQPPPYRTRPLPSGTGALTPAGPPSARPSRSPPLPHTGPAPIGSLLPQRPGGPPPTESLPQPHTGTPLLKAPLPSACPGGRPPTAPSQSALLPSGPRALSPSRPRLPAPGVQPLSHSLQALPASPPPSPRLLSGPHVLPFTELPPSQSRSLQHLPTKPCPSPPRGSRVLTLNRTTQPQALLLYPYQTLPLPSGPGVRPPARPPPSQSPPCSPTQPPPSQSLQEPLDRPPPSRSLQPPPGKPPPSQSLLPARGSPRPPESSPPALLPVFRSIRCQLALLEVQGIPPALSDDCGRQPRTTPSKSSPRNVPSRGLSVPLGQREHAWLVAASAGRWAQVRGLFLEEPELALQRDFMSGFTVLHWLAKHGDGPGLQELAAAARQAGLALDVDARSGCGYTPLHLAAIHGHQLVIKVLVLQLGCQVRVRDSSGRRPWEYLGSSTSGEIWQLLEAPRGTIMFPTQPLARSVSSVSKVSLSAGRAALPACLRPQHGRGAASHRMGSESD